MLSFYRRLELYFLASIPSLLTVLLAVLYLVPKHISALSSVMPLLPLMPVFYWGVHHARSIPYWVMFVVGLLLDTVTGLPLGISSFTYILFLWLLTAQRRFFHKEGFLIKWMYMAALLFVLAVVNWLLLSWFHTEAMPITPALMQWVLTVACYPLMHKLFDLLEDHIHTRRWEILHG
jgi:rod shape-determining protein MreD